MHLMIPCASAASSEASAAARRGLRLPHLARLLARLTPTQTHGGDEHSFSTPFERALAEAQGWQGDDGRLPWGAQAAERDGIDTAGRAWGLLTPVHWQVAADHISLADPRHLHLSAQASHTFFEAVRPLFESEGWTFCWGAPTRWHVAHDQLDGLASASIDRVIGRNIDPWLPSAPEARTVRRLQNEVQMLLYQHPLNDERMAQGSLPVNSFWLSGCGRPQPTHAPADLVADLRLRAPWLSGDLAAWSQAWEALDGSAVRAALDAHQRGEAVALTLCGERTAQRFEALPTPWLQRLRHRLTPPPIGPVLEALG